MGMTSQQIKQREKYEILLFVVFKILHYTLPTPDLINCYIIYGTPCVYFIIRVGNLPFELFQFIGDSSYCFFVEENCPENAPPVCDITRKRYDNICHYLGEVCKSRHNEKKSDIPALSMCPEDPRHVVAGG